MKRILSVVVALCMTMAVCGDSFADKETVEYFTRMKNHEIEKYYTDLGKWFSMITDLMKKDSITKPDQSGFKTLNHFLIDSAQYVAQYSADASAEFWTLLYDIDNKKADDPDFEIFAGIIKTLDDELNEHKSAISAVSDFFDEKYKTAFEDSRIDQTEYQDFLAGICVLNDVVQEILKEDSAQDSSKILNR